MVLSKTKVSELHHKYSSHHFQHGKKNIDWLGMIIDWESARFSKADKPLDAYDTYIVKREKLDEEDKKLWDENIPPILKKLGLWKGE